MRNAVVILVCLPLLTVLSCGPREIEFGESLEGLTEVYLTVIAPDDDTGKFDSLRIWQDALISQSLDKHSVHLFKNERDDLLPKRWLDYETHITDVHPGTSEHHYLVRMRFSLSEFARIKRSNRSLDVLATTWERDYSVTLLKMSEIIPFLKMATENMLIEFEHDLIEDNPDRLAGFERRSFR